MAGVSAGHGVMMTRLTRAPLVPPVRGRRSYPGCQRRARMHILSRLAHLMSPWAWVRFRVGLVLRPSAMSRVRRPPRVPNPTCYWAVRICLAIRPVLAVRLPDQARPSGWDGLT